MNWPTNVQASNQRGVTLVELVVAIIIISLAITGALLVLGRSIRSSADPMIREQAVSIAEGYLEEIQLLPFADPDGGETGGPEAGEIRATFDDIQDYNGTIVNENPPQDQNGVAIATLAAYTATVTLTPSTELVGVANTGDEFTIAVSVSHSSGPTVTLSGYRTNF